MITTDPLNAPNMVFSAPAVPDDFEQTFNWCITTLGDLATHLGTYATGIQNILDATDKPMGEIVNASQGEAAQVLSVTWASTRVDGTNARQALIAAQGCIQNIVDKLLAAHRTIQAGMNAIGQVQTILNKTTQITSEGTAIAISHDTISQATHDSLQAQLDALTAVLATIAVIFSTKAQTLQTINDQIPPLCATGFLPGGTTIPLFKKAAFDDSTGNSYKRRNTVSTKHPGGSRSSVPGTPFSYAGTHWTRGNAPAQGTVLTSGMLPTAGQSFVPISGNTLWGSTPGVPGLVLISGDQLINQLPPEGKLAVSLAATVANAALSSQPASSKDKITGAALSLAIGAVAWESYQGSNTAPGSSANATQNVTFIDPTTRVMVSISLQRTADGTVTGTLSDGTQIAVTPETHGERRLTLSLPDNLGKIAETIPTSGDNIIITATSSSGQTTTLHWEEDRTTGKIFVEA